MSVKTILEGNEGGLCGLGDKDLHTLGSGISGGARNWSSVRLSEVMLLKIAHQSENTEILLLTSQDLLFHAQLDFFGRRDAYIQQKIY